MINKKTGSINYIRKLRTNLTISEYILHTHMLQTKWKSEQNEKKKKKGYS